MSKVVKGIGRAVGKVVNGIGKVVTKVTGSKTLGKVFKTVAVAAAVYFTGGAIAGAIGTIGTSTGVLAGAQAGLSASWAGLTSAGSALAAGNLSGAGSALASGWSGAAQAGSMLAGGMPGTVAQVGAAAQASAAGSAIAPVASAGAAGTAAGQAGAGVAKAAGGGFFSNPLVQQAGVQAISGMAQGAMQAKAANDAEKRQDELSAEERARYNANMGGDLTATFQRFAGANVPPVFRYGVPR